MHTLCCVGSGVKVCVQCQDQCLTQRWQVGALRIALAEALSQRAGGLGAHAGHGDALSSEGGAGEGPAGGPEQHEAGKDAGHAPSVVGGGSGSEHGPREVRGDSEEAALVRALAGAREQRVRPAPGMHLSMWTCAVTRAHLNPVDG